MTATGRVEGAPSKRYQVKKPEERFLVVKAPEVAEEAHKVGIYAELMVSL